MSENEVKTILAGLHDLNHRFDGIEERIDILESRMITKHDVFQAVLTVQAFFAVTIVGTIVVLNSVGLFG